MHPNAFPKIRGFVWGGDSVLGSVGVPPILGGKLSRLCVFSVRQELRP